MYADDHGRQVTHRLSASRPPVPAVAAPVEERYVRARARLSAAQQEKMEAGIEFLAARAALRDRLEEIWPGQQGEESAAEAARGSTSRTLR